MEEQGSKSEDAICEVFSDLAKKGTLQVWTLSMFREKFRPTMGKAFRSKRLC